VCVVITIVILIPFLLALLWLSLSFTYLLSIFFSFLFWTNILYAGHMFVLLLCMSSLRLGNSVWSQTHSSGTPPGTNNESTKARIDFFPLHVPLGSAKNKKVIQK